MLPTETKNPYGGQAAILQKTLMKIDRLLPVYIRIVLLKFGVDNQRQVNVKFGVDIQRQTNARVWRPKIQYGHQAAILKLTSLKFNRLRRTRTSNVLLKFRHDIQSQLNLEFRNQKNPIWPPGGDFKSDKT